MKRFEVINGSKFEYLSQTEMTSVKGGGFCLSCMKRLRKIRIGSRYEGPYIPIKEGLQFDIESIVND